jgi:hypothetical protein
VVNITDPVEIRSDSDSRERPAFLIEGEIMEMTKKELIDSIQAMTKQLNREMIEVQIRLYGILWLLVEQAVISEGRAQELAKVPLRKMIDECLQYRASLEE